jgi:hypothetical protein
MNRTVRTLLLVAGFVSLMTLTGCTAEEPAGQVIAKVGSTEITLAELNEEARSRNLDIAGNEATRRALIQALVDRKLLVEEARRRQLDRTPHHILATRRLGEIALSQQLLEAEAKEQGTVLQPDLEKFAADNPQAFADRAAVTVHVAALDTGLTPALRQALASAPDRTAMERLLAQANVKAGWTREVWDSAAPPPGLKALPVSGTFAIPIGQQLVIGEVIDRRQMPVPSEQRLEVARAMIERGRAEQAMARILEKAKASTAISLKPDAVPSAAGKAEGR